MHYLYYYFLLLTGNLDKTKSGYVYQLPKDAHFDLFGANYDESFQQENVSYRGKVYPDDLPGLLKGSFGLAWDGPSAETCSDVFGEYLKYNNPHKTSLFFAAGLPVLVWREAAISEFIQSNFCGILIDSLNEISDVLQNITDEQYDEMLTSVNIIRQKIILGEYMKKALEISIMEYSI